MATESSLREMSMSLYGEFYLLGETGRGLQKDIDNGNKVIRAALWDSYRVHARSLYHFFYPPTKDEKKDITERRDVYAVDYVENWIEKRREIDRNFARDFCNKVSKFVVHVSYDRTSDAFKDADMLKDCEKAWADLSTAFQTFIALVPDDLLCDKLIKQKRKATNRTT